MEIARRSLFALSAVPFLPAVSQGEDLGQGSPNLSLEIELSRLRFEQARKPWNKAYDNLSADAGRNSRQAIYHLVALQGVADNSRQHHEFWHKVCMWDAQEAIWRQQLLRERLGALPTYRTGPMGRSVERFRPEAEVEALRITEEVLAAPAPSWMGDRPLLEERFLQLSQPTITRLS